MDLVLVIAPSLAVNASRHLMTWKIHVLRKMKSSIVKIHTNFLVDPLGMQFAHVAISYQVNALFTQVLRRTELVKRRIAKKLLFEVI